MKSLLGTRMGQKFSVLWIAVGAGVGVAFTAAVACSDVGRGTTIVAACIDSTCKPDNKCLSDGKETKCRLTCDNDQSANASCPDGYYCKTGVTAGANYCEVGDLRTTWGKSCAAAVEEVTDDVCGPLPNFKCFGRAPLDAQAFCTIADCVSDADCSAPGYHCATVDQAPNVRAAKRSFGKTVKWCLPRTQCAPCKEDSDCPAAEGENRCVKDKSGVASCMKVCASNGECLRDHACAAPQPAQPDNTRVCFPIGGSCKGDGLICSRCGSDDDCVSKLCLADPFTDERNCAGNLEATKCNYTACRVIAGEPQNADCESGWCLRTSATTAVCAAGSATPATDAGVDGVDGGADSAADAGEVELMDAATDPDAAEAGEGGPESCRGTAVPKGAFRFCTEGANKAYCVGLKKLPSGGSYPGCFSRDTSGR